jgi:hypothetical protein
LSSSTAGVAVSVTLMVFVAVTVTVASTVLVFVLVTLEEAPVSSESDEHLVSSNNANTPQQAATHPVLEAMELK